MQVDQNLDCPHLRLCFLKDFKQATFYFDYVCKWLNDAVLVAPF